MNGVYAIILNYNNFEQARDAIDSLRSESTIAEIILVDNASDDGSYERLQEEFSNTGKVRFFRNGENSGFSAGNNTGIKYALSSGADYIFLLNNDAEIHRGAVDSMVEHLEKRPGAGMAGPRIFYDGSECVWHGGGDFNYLRTGPVNPEGGKHPRKLNNTARRVGFLTMCAILIDCSVFENIGLLDEDYTFYMEDLDFSMRAERAGYDLLYVPDAVASHKIENIATDRTSPFVLYHRARSRMIFLRKHFSYPYLTYAFLIHILVFTPFRLSQVARGPNGSRAAIEWFRGTIKGMSSNISKPTKSPSLDF